MMEETHIIACGVSDRVTTLEWLRRRGTNTAFQAANGSYINAGIIVFDPVRWRQEGLDRSWVELVATQSEHGFDFQDQDVLNYLLAGKVGLLPPGFNHIVSEPTKGAESILHFAGSPKPWRLTESGRAQFVATEAANFDRPKDHVWDSGEAWELFPRYWEAERAVVASLREKGEGQLLNDLLALRESQLTTLPFRQRVKFWGIRLLARQFIPSFVRP